MIAVVVVRTLGAAGLHLRSGAEELLVRSRVIVQDMADVICRRRKLGSISPGWSTRGDCGRGDNHAARFNHSSIMGRIWIQLMSQQREITEKATGGIGCFRNKKGLKIWAGTILRRKNSET
jgi:hypothetical protein